MWRIRIMLLIFLIYISYINSIVVFPFKISQKNEKKIKTSNDLYSTSYLGDPKQLTDIYFTSSEYLYFLDINQCKGYNYFNKNFSTYEISKFSIYVDDEDDELGKVRAFQVNETFYYYSDSKLTNLEKITNFPFLIKEKDLQSQQGCLLLGILFRTKKDNNNREINFIEQLKNRKIINSYTWTFKFTNDYEGLFILGGEPHTYDPSNYNESNYVTTLPPTQQYISSLGWNMTFEKVYSGENQISDSTHNRFSFSIEFFLGDNRYNKTIYIQYFKKYIDEKRCSFHYVSTGHCYYYCDKKKFTNEDINKLPALSFLNIRLEMNFSFIGEDLFYEDNDYYYFRVYFMDYSAPNWLLGQPFFKKYQLIFNYDQKTIGFYNNWRKEKEDKEKNNGFFSNDNLYLYLAIPVAIIIFTFIIFVLTKFVFCEIWCQKKRKRLVNELDDEAADYFDVEGKNQNSINDEKKLYKSNE